MGSANLPLRMAVAWLVKLALSFLQLAFDLVPLALDTGIQVWNSVEINEMILDPESGFGEHSGLVFKGCPSGWKQHGTQCYFFGGLGQHDSTLSQRSSDPSLLPQSWDEAEELCKGEEAHLTSLRTLEERLFVSSHADNPTWIGARYLKKIIFFKSLVLGNWMWADQRPWEASSLISSQLESQRLTDENQCGFLKDDNLRSGSCNEKRPFVCGKPLFKAATADSNNSATTDSNNVITTESNNAVTTDSNIVATTVSSTATTESNTATTDSNSIATLLPTTRPNNAATTDSNSIATTDSNSIATLLPTTDPNNVTESVCTGNNCVPSNSEDLWQVVVGGFGDSGHLSSVELFPRPSSPACSIPDLPQPRYGNSLSLLSGGRLVVCGAYKDSSNSILDSCITWGAGNASWTPLYNMSVARNFHTAWTPQSLPNSIILLAALAVVQQYKLQRLYQMAPHSR